MEKQRFNKTSYKDMIRKAQEIHFNSLYAKCMAMDFALFNDSRHENGLKFSQDYHIHPNNNFYLNTILFMSKFNHNGRRINDDDMMCFGKLIEEQTIRNLTKYKHKGILSTINSQNDWQKPYLFTTYLLYLLLNEPEINNLLPEITDLTASEISSICLYNKILSEPNVALNIYKDYNLSPSKIMDALLNFLIYHLNYITCDLEEFKQKQESKLIESKYNLFFTHLVLKDYPIVKIEDKYYYSSYYYVQNGIFSRTINSLAKKGENSNLIGDIYEQVIFNIVKKCYTHFRNDSLGDDPIRSNPKQKENELCDVLIKNGDKYLLIDCKATDFVENIYNDNSKNLNIFKEKYNQRFKRIKNIVKGKYSNYLPANINVDNVYSLIAVVNDCCYSKSLLLDEEFEDIKEEDKEYCMKHIDFITYNDLLRYIISDVDLIYIFERAISENTIENQFFTNVKGTDIHEYNICFKEWYDAACKEMIEMIKNYKFFDQ